MIDPNRFEREALRAASLEAGHYIDCLAKTELQHYSLSEWCTLIEVIVTAYQDALRSALIRGDDADDDSGP